MNIKLVLIKPFVLPVLELVVLPLAKEVVAQTTNTFDDKLVEGVTHLIKYFKGEVK